MKIKYLLLLIVPAFLYASGGGHDVEKDILERAVNFIIFAAILYYFIAEPLKNLFQGRTAKIAKELENIQEELKKSQKAKAIAVKSVEDAKLLSAEIIQNAKNEAELLSRKIKEESANEIANLAKSHKDKIEIEERKMVREVVSEVIEDIFEDNTVSLNKDDFVNLVLKKAA